jgi:hypothetical protein
MQSWIIRIRLNPPRSDKPQRFYFKPRCDRNLGGVRKPPQSCSSARYRQSCSTEFGGRIPSLGDSRALTARSGRVFPSKIIFFSSEPVTRHERYGQFIHALYDAGSRRPQRRGANAGRGWRRGWRSPLGWRFLDCRRQPRCGSGRRAAILFQVACQWALGPAADPGCPGQALRLQVLEWGPPLYLNGYLNGEPRKYLNGEPRQCGPEPATV